MSKGTYSGGLNDQLKDGSSDYPTIRSEPRSLSPQTDLTRTIASSESNAETQIASTSNKSKNSKSSKAGRSKGKKPTIVATRSDAVDSTATTVEEDGDMEGDMEGERVDAASSDATDKRSLEERQAEIIDKFSALVPLSLPLL